MSVQVMRGMRPAATAFARDPALQGRVLHLDRHDLCRAGNKAVHTVGLHQRFAANLESVERSSVDQLVQLGRADAQGFAGFFAGKG